MGNVLAKEPTLDEAGVGPGAVLEQGRLRDAAFAGLLAPVQRRDNRRIECSRAGMVTHARYGTGGLGLRRGTHHVHQACASPIDGGVESGSRSFIPLLAI